MAVDSPYSPNDLTFRISPQVVAAIANAALKLHFIFWGNDGKHIAEMVARIATVDGPLHLDTVRRGLGELDTLRKARTYGVSFLGTCKINEINSFEWLHQTLERTQAPCQPATSIIKQTE